MLVLSYCLNLVMVLGFHFIILLHQYITHTLCVPQFPEALNFFQSFFFSLSFVPFFLLRLYSESFISVIDSFSSNISI